MRAKPYATGQVANARCGDRGAVDPARERPEHAPAAVAEPAGAERVGDRGRGVADEQRALEREREILDRAAREPLRVLARELLQRRGQRVEVGVEPPVAAAAQLALGQERGQPLGLARERAQHVERDHVARALPDPVERRVAQQLRHRRLLDVAVAAQALERLGGVRRRALADPVLHDRGAEAAQRLVVLVVGAREPQRRRGRRLGLDRQVGEHVDHQRLLGQARAERAAVAGVVDRLGDAAPHRRRAADDAVQPRVRDHLDDRRDAAALLAQQPGRRAAELDLARGERARAELVLQALDLEARAALDDEAREPAGRLREHEEDVAHRVRAEPLVAGQLVRAVAGGLGARRAGAHVRAALLLGHRHAAQRAALVVGQRQPRLPLGRELRVDAQRRDRRVRHRHRAHHAGVGLRPQQLERRARDVRAGPRLAPRQRVDLALDRAAQQPVPARVVVDAVDAVPVAVVRLQPRLVALGAAAVLLRLGRAGDRAAVAHAVDRPAAPSRSSPSRSARSASKKLTSSNGGGWLRTSWVPRAGETHGERYRLPGESARTSRLAFGDDTWPARRAARTSDSPSATIHAWMRCRSSSPAAGRGRQRLRDRAAARHLRPARPRRRARRAREPGRDDRRRGPLRDRVRHRQDPLRRPRLGRDPHRDPAGDRRRARRAAQRRGHRAGGRARGGRLQRHRARQPRASRPACGPWSTSPPTR